MQAPTTTSEPSSGLPSSRLPVPSHSPLPSIGHSGSQLLTSGKRWRRYPLRMPWLRIDIALSRLVIALVWVAAAPFSRKTVRRETASSPRLRFPRTGCGPPDSVLGSPALIPHVSTTARSPTQRPGAGIVSVALTALRHRVRALGAFHARPWQELERDRHRQAGPRARSGGPLTASRARHPIYTGAVRRSRRHGDRRRDAPRPCSWRMRPRRLLVSDEKMRVEERFMTEQFGSASTRPTAAA